MAKTHMWWYKWKVLSVWCHIYVYVNNHLVNHQVNTWDQLFLLRNTSPGVAVDDTTCVSTWPAFVGLPNLLGRMTQGCAIASQSCRTCQLLQSTGRWMESWGRWSSWEYMHEPALIHLWSCSPCWRQHSLGHLCPHHQPEGLRANHSWFCLEQWARHPNPLAKYQENTYQPHIGEIMKGMQTWLG